MYEVTAAEVARYIFAALVLSRAVRRVFAWAPATALRRHIDTVARGGVRGALRNRRGSGRIVRLARSKPGQVGRQPGDRRRAGTGEQLRDRAEDPAQAI